MLNGHCGEAMLRSLPRPQSTWQFYSVVVKTFAFGVEVPLAARVRALAGAEFGATPTVLQIIVFKSTMFDRRLSG